MRNQKTEPNNKKQKQNTNNTKENTTKQQTTKKYPKRKSGHSEKSKTSGIHGTSVIGSFLVPELDMLGPLLVEALVANSP